MNRVTTPIVGAVRRLYRWDHKMDPRIAWLSPMPPARSGIATYSQAVLEGLERIGYTPGEAQDPAVLADQAPSTGRRCRGTRWASTTSATTWSSTATSTTSRSERRGSW